jgi:sigma-E factor negative regulatory protein RseB
MQGNKILSRYFFQSSLTILFIGSLLISVAHASTATKTERTAREWLGQMSHSYCEQNYRGVFTYESGENIESLRITHGVINGEEFERLEYLDGEKREVSRRGDGSNCIHSSHQLIHLSSNQDEADRQYSALESHYDISLAGKTRVAGREVVVVSVLAKDIWRFGHRLCFDEQTGLLLKAELLNSEQQVLERFQFVELNIGDSITVEDLRAGDGVYQAGHKNPKIPAQAATTSSPKVNWLPGGFILTVVDAGGEQSDMATFSDGLAVFSVFIEPVSIESSGVREQARKGAMVVYSQGLAIDGKPHQVTVVGEIPVKTAQQVAQSVTLATP